MNLPEPVPGLVIRYSYLWRDERLRKQEEGSKDRPCMIVVAVRKASGATVVTVAPITTRPPPPEAAAIELPPTTKKRLGLDHRSSWIITYDLNEFTWPGPDIRPANRNVFAHGLVSRVTFHQARDAILGHARAGKLTVERRG